MQLMPGTAKQLGVTDIYDPGQNIMGGTKYLSMYYNKYGNWTDTLGAYNAGEDRVAKYGGGANIPFKETQDYITSIKNKVPQYF
jgi:soluble lytic murein transglycosylase-like protein